MNKEAISRNQNIRWMLLLILYAQRMAGVTLTGGWLGEDVLRRLLSAEGYALELGEFRTFCDYLASNEIGCIEGKNFGDALAPEWKYKLTAKGMRAASREERVPGVGLTGDA